jgi:hypothetical protein
MKRLVCAGLLMILCTPSGIAQDRGFGLGVILGEPTGLSAKGWIASQSAFDVGVAWSFRHKGFFHVHADYLWHFSNAIRASERFVPYVGIGGRFGAVTGNAIFGVRIPFGLAWMPRNAPIDVFVEVAPVVDLAPATEFTMNGGIGARFFFR